MTSSQAISRLVPLAVLLIASACSNQDNTPQQSASADLGSPGNGVDLGHAIDGGAPDFQRYDMGALDAREEAEEEAVARVQGETEPFCPVVMIAVPPEELGLDPHYTQYVDLAGIPLVGSSAVPPATFRVAYYVIANMLRDRPCEHQALVRSGIRIGLIGQSERTTEMPEYRDFYDAFPGTDWDQRGRGFGATQVRPLTTGAEENLLRLRGDGWAGENILLHEFAHSYFEFGVLGLVGGAELEVRLNQAYARAVATGIWANTYAETNAAEYWAEGVQSWFDNNLEANPSNGVHGHINTRSELAQFDPSLETLITGLFSSSHWASYCDPTGTETTWINPLDELDSTNCAFAREYPVLMGCELSSQIRSQNDNHAAIATFVNRTYAEIDLFWLDYSGEEIALGSLAARSEWSIDTYSTHAFVARTEAGACLGIYRAGDLDASIFTYE